VLRHRSTRERGRKWSTTSFVSGIAVGLVLFSLISFSRLFRIAHEEAAWAEKQRSSHFLSDLREDGGIALSGGIDEERGRKTTRPFTIVIWR